MIALLVLAGLSCLFLGYQDYGLLFMLLAFLSIGYGLIRGGRAQR